ncbi:hypothetical protein VNO77_41519 [Canavalia gladiata]|uniref:Uncharacterized protein n=1 Tax=Canavalia gladiata TaxID=3824 RepID=A0AAN9PSK9_CANGL
MRRSSGLNRICRYYYRRRQEWMQDYAYPNKISKESTPIIGRGELPKFQEVLPKNAATLGQFLQWDFEARK